MYDVTDRASFDCMDILKKEIDKSKEKKEVRYIRTIRSRSLWCQRSHVYISFNVANLDARICCCLCVWNASKIPIIYLFSSEQPYRIFQQ